VIAGATFTPSGRFQRPEGDLSNMAQINSEDFVNDAWRKDIRALRTGKVNQ
jgi:hypothetical protein